MICKLCTKLQIRFIGKPDLNDKVKFIKHLARYLGMVKIPEIDRALVLDGLANGIKEVKMFGFLFLSGKKGCKEYSR